MKQAHCHKYRSPNRLHDRQFFYKYVTAEVAKIILTTRKLRWSSPLLFNDPFDVTQDLRLNFDASELTKSLAEEFASLIEQGNASSVGVPYLATLLDVLRHADRGKRSVIASEFRKEVPGPNLGAIQAYDGLKNTWREMVPSFRILSLSELKDVTSMWLHYAGQYKGVVLEFESLEEIDSCFLAARPVIYQDSPPAIADVQTWVRCILNQNESSYSDHFTEFLYIKTTAWSYEREWRIVSSARPGETGLFADYPMHPRALRGLYFGPKCSANDKSDILSLLAHGLEHVLAYEAVESWREARFSFDCVQR
jgi:hypothetical protein